MSNTLRLAIGLTLAAAAGATLTTVAGPPGPVPNEATAPGADVAVGLDGLATVLRLAPDGAAVRKGDVVAELEATALREQLDDAQAAVARDQHAVEDARRDRAEAELAMEEYRVGTFPLEVEAVNGDIEVARAGLDLATTRYDFARVPTPIELEVRQQATVEFLRARTALAQAEGRRVVLTKYTNPRRLRELSELIRRARAAEQVRADALSRGRSKVDRLRGQVELCKIVAPADGRFVRARVNGAPVAEGVTVLRGQVVARVVAADGSRTR